MKETFTRAIATVVLLAGVFGARLPAHAQGEGDGETNRQLLAAAKDDDQVSALAALQRGAAVDAMNRIGDTALITACKKRPARECARRHAIDGRGVRRL
jgi:hypothetical protein